ncbi:MAG: DUF302 domain-containing protein [Gammaproteobacteria bacterium]|nr:DUF302 domain-containing protein [Gammaproteobacteria bacterium]
MGRILLGALLAVATGPLPAGWLVEPDRVVVDVEGIFADVRFNLENAIIGEGLVESGTSRVGEMLERTGRDLGTTSVYGEAVVVEFCSAPLTQALTDADPHDLVHCPYRIAVYTLRARPGTVYLAYPRPTAGGATPEREAIEALLRRVIEGAI